MKRPILQTSKTVAMKSTSTGSLANKHFDVYPLAAQELERQHEHAGQLR